MHTVSTGGAPRPAGHYSQATVHAGVVYVAGQLPIDPNTGTIVNGEVEAQAERALTNLEMILAAAGSSLGQVLRVSVYIADIALWGRFNTVYARAFGDHRPARTVVPVPALHHGALVEIDAIATVTP